jgi:nucleotide-binding universal stress UspA family protein
MELGPERVRRVVVGVGESPSGAAALAWALDLCRSRGWVLDVVAAWPDVGQARVHEVPGHYCEPRGRAVAALQAALAGCGVEADEPDVTVHVENADPIRALLDRSRGAELLVLGASGGGASRRAGHPPLSEVCRRRASCPVVVVDGEDAVPERTA